jgi:DNA-binding transcriptional regulator YdaS (Cro superfamily)
MDLHAFLVETDTTQQDFAAAIGVSQSLVHQWVRRVALPPPVRCVQIERYTAGRVARPDLRPDDWWQIWPELTWSAAWQAWGSPQASPRAAVRGELPDGAKALCAARGLGGVETSASVGTSFSP